MQFGDQIEIQPTGGAAMTRCVCFGIAVVSFLCLWGCNPEKTEKETVLVHINDYALTLNDFNTLLKEELEYRTDAKLSRETEQNFLDQLITKELLIQEAKRRQLDSKENFIRAIERYWEATLIRDLMALEVQAIEQRTVASEEEIEARYDSLLKSNPDQPPLESIRDEISREILKEKKERSLEEWISRLRTDARIRVNEGLLNKEAD